MDSTPTVDDLKTIYYSDLYQQMLADYDKEATHKLDQRDDDVASLYNSLSRIRRGYSFIGLTTEQVVEHLERIRPKLIQYAISCTDFFIAHPDDVDGDFPEGEEQGDENESELVEVFGIAKDFILEKFCEYYILETMDRDRLLEYLQITRMPQAKKYAGQITKLYKRLA